jgi:glutamate-ammonia-ligase adenylyltransferase
MNYTELSLPQRQREEIHRILSTAADRAGHIDSESILRSLQELTTDDTDIQACFADFVTRLLKASIDSPNAEAALNRFSRFAESSFNRRTLYQLLRDAPHFIRPVILTFGASAYLSEILIRTPEYFYDIIDPNVMGTQKTSEVMYQELAQSISRFASVEQKLRILRRYKRRETLRIGLRDLLKMADVETTTLELSNLAEAALQHCYEIGRDQIMKSKFGTPLNEEGTAACRFAIIGMGKLGGYELNFSSDIDLIFVYSDDGCTDMGGENSEYFSRLCEFIIKAMSEITPEGYVFRVDIRLRPESSAGVIIRSMESYESYYEGWGDLWERQALIKARPVAGDMAFGDEFIRMIQPFVYQRYLDGVTLTEIKADIRRTKARIEERLVSEGANLEKHVKLGPGAIRDIEFTVQCLQMIHGAKRKSLCSHNTLEVIAALKASELLSAEDADALMAAYRFLRTVENGIQIEADQQRYSIPERETEERELARRVGYPHTAETDALEAFREDYRVHTGHVRSIFKKITATSIQSEDGLDIAILLSEENPQQLETFLSAFRFENVRNAQRLLRQLANGGDGIQFSPNVRRTFFKLAPTLLNVLRDSPNPDMALRYLAAFTDKVGARSSYYTMFAEKPSTLEVLTRVCGTSLYLADMLIASPELFDLLTVPTLIERSKTFPEKQAEALQVIAQAAEGRMLSMLRRYKNDEIWRIALRNILGNATLPDTTQELSDLAEAILQAIYPEIEAELREAHGTPLAPDGTPVTFAIVAMGKFGGRELNFSSDLDVMYVYSADGETTKGMPNVEYFAAVGLELVNRLAGNQGMGIYEVDLRLRPHGTGGAIALPLAGYQNYYDNTAEVWERQALTRARVVAGDIKHLGNRFLETAHAFCYGDSLTPEEIAEIVHTRQRKEAQATRKTSTRRRRGGKTQTSVANVKSGYGGLVDIEFAVQTLQLVHGGMETSVRVQNTPLALDRLHKIGVLTEAQRDGLGAAYQFLRRVENALRIVHDRALDALPRNQAELGQLARRLGYTEANDTPTVEAFLQDYGKWTETTRALFNEILVGD